MEQKFPLKRLLLISANISITIGILALIMITAAQSNLINPLPSFFIWLDFSLAGIISCVLFSICLVNIWTSWFIDKRFTNKIKGQKVGFLVSVAFSAIPLLCGALVFRFIRHMIMSKIDIHPYPFVNSQFHYQFKYILIIFIVILFAVSGTIHLLLDFVLMRNKNTRLALENAELRVKNIEATYRQLRQQIHPHFLFNSLNTLKTLVDGNTEAEVFVKRLSDFLRTSITVNDQFTISLADELKFCIDYLELQKVRFRDALQYSIDIPEEARMGFVPVFAIQQLIENAIKHNVLTLNHPLLIKIECDKDRIVVSNRMRAKNTAEESTGIGLINLIERYKILSGNEVIIRTDNNYFSVSLKILSHEDRNNRG